MANRPLQLISRQEDCFSLSRSAARGSALFQDMLENSPLDEPIVLPNINTEVLAIVVEYLNYYAKSTASPTPIQKPVRCSNFAELVSEWEYSVVDKQTYVVFSLITAAGYLGISGLRDLAAAKIAVMISGKTAEEMRHILGIVTDLTPEEIEAVEQENKWADDL